MQQKPFYTWNQPSNLNFINKRDLCGLGEVVMIYIRYFVGYITIIHISFKWYTKTTILLLSFLSSSFHFPGPLIHYFSKYHQWIRLLLMLIQFWYKLTSKHMDIKIMKLLPEPPKIENFSLMQYSGILRNIPPCQSEVCA